MTSLYLLVISLAKRQSFLCKQFIVFHIFIIVGRHLATSIFKLLALAYFQSPLATIWSQNRALEWEMESNVIATHYVEERHTGVNIAGVIRAILDEFGIGKIVALVTDNAGNMGIAARELESEQVCCFAHTLQLAIEDGLKLPQIAKTLAAARRVVGHFSHSVLATSALLSKQDSIPALKLIQDVPTRWNSSFLMMQRLLKLRVPVYSVIFDDEYTKPGDRMILDIKDCFWKTMEDVVPVLEPLAEVTEILGKDSTPTGSSVFILLQNLISDVLKIGADDSGALKDMKQKIADGLKKRFKISERGSPENIKSPLVLAAFLDPRYKATLSKILKNEEMQELKTLVLEKMMPMQTENIRTDECDEPPKKKTKMQDIIKGDILDEVAMELSPESELEKYLAEPVRLPCPLSWWKLHQWKFQRLSKLARIYLAVPATSIPSERTFSTAGQTVTKLRSSLDPETVDQLLFINRNFKFSK
jgi:hypothetical protein